ncbi:MAG: hypothetical protein M3R57_05680, partial [Chloroflexota bacterium]|nr:hypothetical protein [Chloroflexota bacterium]
SQPAGSPGAPSARTPAASPSGPGATPAAPSPSTSEPPEGGPGTATGDVPDNAVFITFHDKAHGFAIQYVEGWQVLKDADGVTIRDKDSSETVRVVPGVTDAAAYASGTDLPALRAEAGFKFDHQDSVTVGGLALVHVVYHLPSPPDPVTGKRIPSTVDRYYVPGPAGLAVVSLSTPDGVDNVDAFRTMIESFTWE